MMSEASWKKGQQFKTDAFLSASNVFLSRLYESLSDHGLLADGAEEAPVVPGQLLEGHELGVAQAALSCSP